MCFSPNLPDILVVDCLQYLNSLLYFEHKGAFRQLINLHSGEAWSSIMQAGNAFSLCLEMGRTFAAIWLAYQMGRKVERSPSEVWLATISCGLRSRVQKEQNNTLVLMLPLFFLSLFIASLPTPFACVPGLLSHC